MWINYHIGFRLLGLAYEGNSSFLQKKCNNALQKAMTAMNDEAEFQCNKLLKLDNTMLMYRIYNAEMLEKLINTVKELHNVNLLMKNCLQENISPHYLELCI